ncbi:acyl-CoA-binding domain-containing protein 6-like [Babylonia areolata]|uniref:acyl-CoA-binding domain-containing protein 6-like n=1 Tax=Babylonia areolata TaxID=304850 RepID=UPI003FD3E259
MEDVADDFETEESLADVFQAATNYVRQTASKFDADKLLYFYARYKQVQEGPCTTPKPGFFDFQGKQKWEAWKQLGDKSRTESMLEYVSLLSNLQPGWEDQHHRGAEGGGGGGTGEDVSLREKTRSGMGVAVSTMVSADEHLSDGDKTVYDWCQEGAVDRVKDMLSAGHPIDQLDKQGIGLLHWASDRGLTDMAATLLDAGASVNLQDCEGQTAMHYGANSAMVMLAVRGADTHADNDAESP